MYNFPLSIIDRGAIMSNAAENHSLALAYPKEEYTHFEVAQGALLGLFENPPCMRR